MLIRTLRTTFLLAAGAALVLLLPASSVGQNLNWTGNAGTTSWADGANWSSNATPVPNDVIRFHAGAFPTIPATTQLDGDVTASGLFVLFRAGGPAPTIEAGTPLTSRLSLLRRAQRTPVVVNYTTETLRIEPDIDLITNIGPGTISFVRVNARDSLTIFEGDIVSVENGLGDMVDLVLLRGRVPAGGGPNLIFRGNAYAVDAGGARWPYSTVWEIESLAQSSPGVPSVLIENASGTGVEAGRFIVNHDATLAIENGAGTVGIDAKEVYLSWGVNLHLDNTNDFATSTQIIGELVTVRSKSSRVLITGQGTIGGTRTYGATIRPSDPATGGSTGTIRATDPAFIKSGVYEVDLENGASDRLELLGTGRSSAGIPNYLEEVRLAVTAHDEWNAADVATIVARSTPQVSYSASGLLHENGRTLPEGATVTVAPTFSPSQSGIYSACLSYVGGTSGHDVTLSHFGYRPNLTEQCRPGRGPRR